jgi:membrane-bound lytic murein transglycosylase MltF
MSGRATGFRLAASAVAAGAVLAGLLAVAGCGGERRAAREEATRVESPSPPAPAIPEELASLVDVRKEDLGRLVERRKVRLLVTYGATSYFVDRGSQGGWAFEAGRLLEQELNRRFRPGSRLIHVVFVPVTRDQLLPALLEGRGDVAVANLTITPARSAQVAFSTPLVSDVREVVVTGPGAPPLRAADELSGREVFVRASSSYAESLAELDESLRARGRPPVRVRFVDERLEDEDVLEMVAAGLLPATVVDDSVARLWAEVFPALAVHGDVALRTGGRIAWAMRPADTELRAFVDDFARRHRVGTKLGNVIRNRYLRDAERLRNPMSDRDLARFRDLEGVFREQAESYGFDHLMLMALAYRESGLDQSRRSRRGAVGIMQVMPATAADRRVGVRDIHLLENNVLAGTRYLRVLLDQLLSGGDLEPIERHLFAVASYNAGAARIARLRTRAASRGYDPNRWFGNVEIEAARDIGRETPQHVAHVFKYFLAYRLVAERSEGRARARDAKTER